MNKCPKCKHECSPDEEWKCFNCFDKHHEGSSNEKMLPGSGTDDSNNEITNCEVNKNNNKSSSLTMLIIFWPYYAIISSLIVGILLYLLTLITSTIHFNWIFVLATGSVAGIIYMKTMCHGFFD